MDNGKWCCQMPKVVPMQQVFEESIIDDSRTAAFTASAERLKSLNVYTVYPGHGKPFRMEWIIKNDR